MSTFASNASLSPDIVPPHNIGSYPAISGSMVLQNVTFARFAPDNCGHNNSVIMSNPLSSDAQHPTTIIGADMVEVDPRSRLWIHDPNPSDVALTACVNQACDGQKQVLVRDTDGFFFG
jgi:hypothetical protein